MYSGGFRQLWWIDSKSIVCNFLHGFQQVTRLYDGIELTLVSIAGLAMQASGGYYFFQVLLDYHSIK